jgi:hypothetical protein
MHTLRTATLRIEAAAAEARLSRAVSRMASFLKEAKYHPDQPRVPAGHSDGGQWTRVGAASRVRVASGLGRVTFSGPLIRTEYDRKNDRILCLYRDTATGYIFSEWWNGAYCPSGRLGY